MRKLKAVLAILCALVMGTAPARAASKLELFAVNVGKADAVFIRAGECVALVDTGKAWGRGRILCAMEHLGIDRIDAVLITHTDKDHVGGAEWLAESGIPVGAWYASGCYTGIKKKSKHPLVRAIKNTGAEVTWLTRGDTVALGDATFSVLAPFERSEDDENDNSLVMMLASDAGRALLCGDMNFPEEAALMQKGDDLRCDVLKVAHHGSKKTLSEAFLERAQPRLAVISSEARGVDKRPDASTVARIEDAGAEIAVTGETGLGVHVTIEDGNITCEAVPLDAPAPVSLVITSVDPELDTVTIENRGATPADLTDCYLCSDRKDTLYVFPQGMTLGAGEAIAVEGKGLIHEKKSDTVSLNDRWGRRLSQMDNGL